MKVPNHVRGEFAGRVIASGQKKTHNAISAIDIDVGEIL